MIQAAQKDAKAEKNKPACRYIAKLLETHSQMVAEAEALYASLNVTESFPDLEGVSFQFVHTLLMARELKINIRQRLVGRFFEMSRLDQAAGGMGAPIGSSTAYSRQSIVLIST